MSSKKKRRKSFLDKYVCSLAWKRFLVHGCVLFVRSLERPKLVLHLFVFVMFVGGLGASVTFVRGMLALTPICQFFRALSMYALTLVAASFADAILDKKDDEPDSDTANGYDMMFPYTCGFVSTAGIAVLGIVLSYLPAYPVWSWGVSMIAVSLSVAFWLQVNAPKMRWADETNPDFAWGDPDGVADEPNADELGLYHVQEVS
jgi:hypothetical protein